MFVEVILPLALPGTFTYKVPEGLVVPCTGVRVAVPFGRGRRQYSAVVVAIQQEAPVVRAPRAILSVLDGTPVVTAKQLALWQRIADHYMCGLGEVMLAALPGPLNISSQTRLIATPQPPEVNIAPREAVLLDALEQQQVLTMDEAAVMLGLKDPMPVVKGMMERGLLLLEEELRQGYTPRMVQYVKLTHEASGEESLHRCFDMLQKAPKQMQLLMKYIEIGRCLSEHPKEVPRKALLREAGADPQALRALCDKQILEIYERPEDIPAPEHTELGAPALTTHQLQALEQLHEGLAEHRVALLRGVTSSGKTEVYASLMEEALARGEQVLYLLPEIALTTQVIARMRARFGERVAIYHSRLTQRERTALWLRMLHDPGTVPIVVGARSALFLPFTKLGLVIADEEHDPSYKQHDPAPRYHARDMAVVLASLHDARTVLGSATPSMESRYNAQQGKYAYAELLVRYGDVSLPEIVLVDLRDQAKRKLMTGHFSQPLMEAIKRALDRRERVILFQNRRGYVPVWQCETCSWVPGCDSCDVNLTYHKRDHALRCHYCGHRYRPPTHCEVCGSSRLRMLGLGTERIEEEVAALFPEANVARMDQDTTRGRHAFDRILSQFAEGAVDILVGTQMVTKGLDFERVSVIGILNADSMLRYPDLRAHERAFQLMAQVAGRSGRAGSEGMVYIQARDMAHPVFEFVLMHDSEGMYTRELEMRRAHGYPPFMRLVRFTLKHRHEERADATARALVHVLQGELGDRVLGPEIPAVSRVRDQHIRNVLVKLHRSQYARQKAFVQEAIDRLFSDPAHAAVRLVTDVDPG